MFWKGYSSENLFPLTRLPKGTSLSQFESYMPSTVKIGWTILTRGCDEEEYCAKSLKAYISSLHVMQWGIKDYTCLFYGNMQFSTTVTLKPLQRLTVNSVAKIFNFAKCSWNPFVRSLSANTWNTRICDLFSILPLLYIQRPNGSTSFDSFYLNRRGWTEEGTFWGSHQWKKHFSGNYPITKIFSGHFACKLKKLNNFWTMRDRHKFQWPIYTQYSSSNRMMTSIPV